MKTLKSIAERIGISATDLQYIQDMAADYRRQGYAAEKAEHAAASDYLNSLLAGREDIVRQVREVIPVEPEYSSFRQKTRYEKRVNFAQVNRFLDEAEKKELSKLEKLMMKAKQDIAGKIRRGGVNINTLKGINALSTKAGIRRELQAHMLGSLDRGRRDVRSEVGLPRSYAEGPNFVPTAAVAFLRQKAIDLTSTTNEAVITAVRRALQKSIETGETTAAAIDRLDEAFRPYMGIPGVLEDGEQLNPNRLEAIVRTETTAAYNQGRLVEARQRGVVDRMRGMQYSAILDSRTTPVCQSLDGKIFAIGDPNLDKLDPPNHVNCRSVLVPITMNDEVDETDFVTPSQVGRSLELAGNGFV